MNAKDAPFATAMAVLLLGLVRAFDEYPQPERAHGRADRRRPRAGVRLARAGRGRRAGRARRAAVRVDRGKPRRRLETGRATLRTIPLDHAAGLGARLSDHGPAMAMVGALAAQSAARGGIFRHVFRKAVAGTVRRPADRGPRHAGELPAASVHAQAAGNHAGARTDRNGRRLHCRRAPQRAGQPPRQPDHGGAAAILPDRLGHAGAAGAL